MNAWSIAFARQMHPDRFLDDDQLLGPVFDLVLEFDDAEGAPLGLLPARLDQPVLDAADETAQVLRIRAHDRVELGELARSEEHLGQAELEVLVVESQRCSDRRTMTLLVAHSIPNC